MQSIPSYSRETTAISEITGKPVGTWSEEWRAECEARAVLSMSPNDRFAYLHGRKGSKGGKSVLEARGQSGLDLLQGYIDRLEAARALRKSA